MTTLQEQLDFEHEMIYRGIHRFRRQQTEAIKGNREHETSAGTRLMQSYVIQISDHIKAYLAGELEGKRRSRYAKLMETVNTDSVALFALRQIIGAVFTHKATSGKRVTLQSVCGTLGGRIEDELRFSAFQTEHKEYYDAVLRNFQEKGTVSYRHQHRVLVFKSNEKGLAWDNWSTIDRVHVGALVIGLLLEVCDLCEIETVTQSRGRVLKYVVPTEECMNWIDKHDAFAELTSPDRMPCLIPPGDWTNAFDGGFWSPRLRHMTPLIKKSNRASGLRRERIDAAVMPRVLRAVNGLQATPWTLNHPVLAVMRDVWKKNLQIGMPPSEPYEIPPCPVKDGEVPRDWDDDDPRKIAFIDWKADASELHAMEAERVAKNRALHRTMRIAAELEDKEKFYYVYQCDFRGRIYCATTGLSPQGTDQSKALLTFGRGEVLGERGLYWLKVHGAGKFGYDKCGYDERVHWIDQRSADWLAVADDPIGQRDVWSGCDKPWQFLAWCFEFAACANDPGYRSSLPVALDGSCNGLQHFSAMLRDSIGGEAVNLLPGDHPADIYQAVADVCTRKLRGLRALNDPDHAAAANWLSLFAQLADSEDGSMPRKLSKKPVMTLPYGSTRQACTESIFRWIHEFGPTHFDKNTNFRHSLYLSPILWSSISEVVVAARAAMRWVQDCSSILSKENHALDYTSPLGFPVVQASFQYESVKIETQIGGRMQLRIAMDNEEIDVRKQRQGSSPNLIHHVDAAHLMMCVNGGLDEDFECFAMIHDDFGVHAANIDKFQSIIRSTFVELHAKADILSNFRDQHEERHYIELPDLPESGTLDLAQVLKSDYFFG